MSSQSTESASPQKENPKAVNKISKPKLVILIIGALLFSQFPIGAVRAAINGVSISYVMKKKGLFGFCQLATASSSEFQQLLEEQSKKQ